MDRVGDAGRRASAGLPWAAFLICVNLATLGFFLYVAPMYWNALTSAADPAPLVLPAAPDAPPDPAPGPPPSPDRQPRDQPVDPAFATEPYPMPSGMLFLVPWLFFVVAAAVAWLVLVQRSLPWPQRGRAP